jgi:hypothetical protein
MSTNVVVNLVGPNYHQSAIDAGNHAAAGTVAEARVLNFGPNDLASLRAALTVLKTLFAPGGQVTVYESTQSLSAASYRELAATAGVPVVVPGPAINLATAMNKTPDKIRVTLVGQEHTIDLATDMDKTYNSQVMDDSQVAQQQRWKILQDAQTEIFQIQQQVAGRKPASADKSFAAYTQYIRD